MVDIVRLFLLSALETANSISLVHSELICAVAEILKELEHGFHKMLG